VSTSNVNPKPEYPAVLKELRDVQSQFFDKASNYTRLIFGLGYGGFFVFWSGAKQYLAPRLVVLSALLMSVSLVFFIVFEVAQTGLISYINLRFANGSAKLKPLEGSSSKTFTPSHSRDFGLFVRSAQMTMGHSKPFAR